MNWITSAWRGSSRAAAWRRFFAPPELEEVLIRALERDPRNRLGSARELASELEHPGRAGARNPGAAAGAPVPRPVLFYSTLTVIPVSIFLLLLYVASHQ
jgi:hypothetical protein